MRDIGKCPACGHDEFSSVHDKWNTWQCTDCETWSTIRDSQLEVVAKKEYGGDRTDLDSVVERGEMSEGEAPWELVNRIVCGFIHRGEPYVKTQRKRA